MLPGSVLAGAIPARPLHRSRSHALAASATVSSTILVIPAAIVDKAVDKALEKDGLENFQRSLILQGESLYEVYPPNDKVRQRYEEYKKNRR